MIERLFYIEILFFSDASQRFLIFNHSQRNVFIKIILLNKTNNNFIFKELEL